MYFVFCCFFLSVRYWNNPDGAWSVCPLMRGVCNYCLLLEALWGICTSFFRSSIFYVSTASVDYSIFSLLRNFIVSIFFTERTISKIILAFLFIVQNKISLSCHEQESLRYKKVTRKRIRFERYFFIMIMRKVSLKT